jgi:hypothetical protein
VCGGKDNPFEKHISNTQTIWLLIAGDEKSIPALKINILWDMSDFVSYFVPTQLQESILSPLHVQKYRFGKPVLTTGRKLACKNLLTLTLCKWFVVK